MDGEPYAHQFDAYDIFCHNSTRCQVILPRYYLEGTSIFWLTGRLVFETFFGQSDVSILHESMIAYIDVDNVLSINQFCPSLWLISFKIFIHRVLNL